MTVLDLMSFLFFVSVFCLVLAGADGVWLAVASWRASRRYRRQPRCVCGAFTLDMCFDGEPVWDGRLLHEADRCFPERES